jgi:hypothetical protein
MLLHLRKKLNDTQTCRMRPQTHPAGARLLSRFNIQSPTAQESLWVQLTVS